MNKLYLGVLLCLVWPHSGHAVVGKIDNREYVDWSQAPYNKIVLFLNKCTGQYIAKDLIITAAHCVYNACYDSELELPSKCTFTNSAGQSGTGRVIAVGREHSLTRGIPFDGPGYTPATDWVLLKTDNLVADSWFHVATETKPGQYNSVGFGGIRIIDDQELPIIRQKYVLFLRQKYDIKHVSSKKILEKTKLRTDMWHEFDEFLGNANDETGVAIAPLFPQTRVIN